MNLNTFNLNRGDSKPLLKKDVVISKFPLMGPPQNPAPRKKPVPSSSTSSQLPWGTNQIISVAGNSSSKKSTPSRSSSSELESRTIIAVTAGRGEARCEVGLAAINVSRPVLILYQTSDTESYINTLTKINILNPNEILYPATFDVANGNRLIRAIQKQYPDKRYTTISRQAFNYKNGQETLQKLSISSSHAILVAVKERSYALAAASALLTYLCDRLYVYYANRSIKIDYQASEGHAIIDFATADRLELVCSTQVEMASRKYSSLFGILNHCLTRGGARTLRSVILQPLYSVKYIEERLECVAELNKNRSVLMAIRTVLPKLYNIDQLISLGSLVPEDQESCSKRQINYLLFLNNLVDLVVGLRENIANLKQPFYKDLHNFLEKEDFETIKTCIRKIINEDAYYAHGQVGETQRIFAIKCGVNGLLDLIRKVYSERIEDIREYVKTLAERYNLPLTLGNNNTKGFHIVLTLNKNMRAHFKKSDLPAEFIQVCRTANQFTMKTPELTNLCTSIDDILADMYQVGNTIIYSLMIEMKKYADLFYQLCEKVAYLDVLQSLAQVSTVPGYVRPRFSNYTEVTFGHHPLLDFTCDTTPVSNPTISCEHYNLHIITGPNGAGKSIFIRQTMLLQIMAQLGCFVPAQSAIFRPADRMFARVYNEDDIESGASSFVLETTPPLHYFCHLDYNCEL